MRPNLLLWLSCFVVIASFFVIIQSTHKSTSKPSGGADEIATQALTKYFTNFKSSSVSNDERLVSFKIQEVHATVYSDSMSIRVKYSVKPFTNGSMYWTSGNGKSAEDGWVTNKSGCTTIQKSKYTYDAITEIGTGCVKAPTQPLIQIGQPTPASGCYYLQVQCVRAPCPPVLTCPNTSNQSPSSWKTYKNSKAGFSFEYNVQPNYVLDTSTEDFFGISQDGPTLGPDFAVSTFSTNKEPLTWWNSEGKITNYYFNKNVVIQKIVFAGKDATKITGQWETPGGASIDAEVILIPHNSFLILVYNQKLSVFRNFIFNSCPTSEYVDCMPGPGAKKETCSQEYLSWAQANCPGFKGAAY